MGGTLRFKNEAEYQKFLRDKVGIKDQPTVVEAPKQSSSPALLFIIGATFLGFVFPVVAWFVFWSWLLFQAACNS